MSERADLGPFVFVLPQGERYDAQGGGAIATFVRHMARCLSADGTVVQVLTPTFTGTPYAEGRAVMLAGVGDAPPVSRFFRRVAARVRPRRWGHRERYARSVYEHLREYPNANVVVANDPALATGISRQYGQSIVLWLHNYMQGAEADAMRALRDDVNVVAVSESVREWTVSQGHAAEERTSVIYNGVDHGDFSPPESRSNSGVRLIMPGRIDPNKGQLLALRALSVLRHRGYGEHAVQIVIAGAPQTFGHGTQSVERYNLELKREGERVGAELVGRIAADRMPDIYRDSDIALILPLVPEPFGLTAIEAMASGCAVIAIPAGGLAEVVGDAAVNVTADPEVVADAMEKLIIDPVLRHEMQVRAVSRSRKFSWEITAQQLRALVDGAGAKS